MPGRFLFFDSAATPPSSSRTRVRGRGLREALRGENGVACFLRTRRDPSPRPAPKFGCLVRLSSEGGLWQYSLLCVPRRPRSC